MLTLKQILGILYYSTRIPLICTYLFSILYKATQGELLMFSISNLINKEIVNHILDTFPLSFTQTTSIQYNNIGLLTQLILLQSTRHGQLFTFLMILLREFLFHYFEATRERVTNFFKLHILCYIARVNRVQRFAGYYRQMYSTINNIEIVLIKGGINYMNIMDVSQIGNVYI